MSSTALTDFKFNLPGSNQRDEFLMLVVLHQDPLCSNAETTLRSNSAILILPSRHTMFFKSLKHHLRLKNLPSNGHHCQAVLLSLRCVFSAIADTTIFAILIVESGDLDLMKISNWQPAPSVCLFCLKENVSGAACLGQLPGFAGAAG